MITDKRQATDFWRQEKLEAGDWLLWEAGTLRLWAKRIMEHEWRIFTSRAPEERQMLNAGQAEEPPAEGAWKRWAFKEEDAVIQIVPVMPDQPVIVRPDSPIRIPRGNEVTFFVSVPVFLQAHIGPERDILIYEEPTVILSKTWFGEPTAGELCYALRTGASRDLHGIKKGQHRAVCPVIIRNRSDEELAFQKLCIRTMHVNIHRGSSRLWTEEIEVSYLGKNNFSEIAFSKSPPAYESTHGILGTARETAPRGFIKRSFETLWSF
jgi:hypothetical protein